MATGNTNRCPECGGFGSSDSSINNLCRACLAKKRCVQCGGPAYKYLDQSPYHSWYCESHYNRKLEELGQEPQHIVRDDFIAENAFTKTDAPVPETNEVGLIKSHYGIERV